MKSYDYIICGFGCAGISFIRQIINSPLKDKNILIVDSDPKKKNDRTWCYWAESPLDLHPRNAPLVFWNKIKIISDHQVTEKNLEHLKYFHIKASDFYREAFEAIAEYPNIEFLQDSVDQIAEGNADDMSVYLKENGPFKCQKVFNSIPPVVDFNSKMIKQIFMGWEISFEKSTFDPKAATFMQFDQESISPNDFFYVLPLSSKSALVEFTTYRTEMIGENEMETYITKYLDKNYPGCTYNIQFKEKGCIPLTTFPMESSSPQRVIQLGTLAGCTKPSSGFTFYNIQKHCGEIVQRLQEENYSDSQKWKRKSRFTFYDNILLNIAKKWPSELPGIFFTMFEKNPASQILKFLNEETTLSEEISILWKLRFNIFIKSLLNYERH
jgi:lycopene beta-cyclase